MTPPSDPPPTSPSATEADASPAPAPRAAGAATVTLPTAFAIAALAAAAAFAAGRATGAPAGAAVATDTPSPAADPHVAGGNGAPPHALNGGALPPSHPAVDPNLAPVEADEPEVELAWKAPPRWVPAPNPSPMRLATFKVPRAPGDAADAEVSLSRAGGSVDDNATRWVNQFDEAGRSKAKRTQRKAGGYDTTVVEVEGTYGGGMGGGEPVPGAALLGAIVASPGFALFVKITGPAKTVKSARAELDQLLDSVAKKSP